MNLEIFTLASIDLTFDELKVTIAHEFNHALQFGLTGYGSNFHLENAWIYESTATWMEDIVYDEVNDWINLYLFDINNEGVRTPLSHPHYPITQEDDDFMYANALFIHFLSEWKNANDLIRQIWLRNAYVGGDPVGNIDYVLSNYYDTSLQEALEEYAVWRYFTGSRDDGNHFEEASSYPELNIQNSHSSLPIQSQMTPSAPGGASYVSFQINDIGIDLDYDGYGISNNYQWTGKTISILDNSDTFIDELLFDENNDGNIIYDLNGIQEIVFFSTVMKGYEEELNIALNYSATLPPNTNISFWNEYVDTNLGGTLSVNSTTVESGQSLPLIDVFQYSAKTNNERFVNTSILKHNNWNQNSSIFYLEKSFDPTEALSQRAKFLPLNYAKLRIKVDGVDVGLGKIKFNDPWYLKSDGTQSGMNDFIEFDAPYEPTGKEGETTGGVFLDQDYNIPGNSYYSVSIDAVQTINYNGSNHKIHFTGWSDNGKATIRDEEFTTTPVVFTDGGAEVYANHKGSLLSSTENALSGTGQRKMVATPSSSDKFHHVVYESMGKVWYEIRSTTNWVLGNDYQPLSDIESKLPSIDFSPNENYVAIVFQKKDNVNPAVSSVKFQVYNNGNKIFENSFGTDGWSSDMKPVVAWGANNTLLIVWKQLFDDTGLHYRKIELNSTCTAVEAFTQGKLSSASSFSNNPSVAADKNSSSSIFYLAWQESNDRIGFSKFTNSNFSSPQYPSNNIGYQNHWNPQILVEGSQVYVGWVGQRYESGQEEPGPIQTKESAFGGGGSTGEWKERGLLRTYENGSWLPGLIKALGSDVDDVDINNSGSGYFFSYYTKTTNMLGDSYYTKGVKSTDLTDIVSVSSGGKSFYLANGSNFSSMFGLELIAPQTDPITGEETDPPYQLRRTNSIGSLQKQSSNELLYIGREGICSRDSVQFYFTFGEVFVDGQQIRFVEPPDSMKKIKNTNQLNKYLLTEPFSLSDNSTFTYGLMYGLADSSDHKVALDDSEFINFKIELIKDKNKHVMGLYNDIRLSSNGSSFYGNRNYEVKTEGIGNELVRLRLQIDDNFKQIYSLGDIVVEDTTLYKKEYHKIHYKGELLVKEYQLVQNYPNPFNPATIIKYNIPKSGEVKLRVFDILGREVTTLVNSYQKEGRYEVEFNASKLSSGVYIYRLEANNFVDSKKMLLVK